MDIVSGKENKSMRDKVLIAGEKGNTADIVRFLGKTYDAIAFFDISSLVGYITENGKKTAAVIATAAFLRENMKAVKAAIKKCRVKIPLLAAGTPSEIEKLADKNGIADYITEPYTKTVVIKRLENAAELLKNKARVKKAAAKLKSSSRLSAEEIQDCIVSLVAGIVHTRNPKCGEHTHFVSRLSRIIAEDIMKHCPEYNMTDKMVEQIAAASILHDMGKVTIPDRILLKPDKLSAEEFEDMKRHTINGEMLFERTRRIWSKDYAKICHNIILYHHERYDGKGYPCGLSGDEIPIEAQIVALADVYDALVANRIYKGKIEPDEAYNMIMRGECGTFSDAILDSLKRSKTKLEEVIK